MYQKENVLFLNSNRFNCLFLTPKCTHPHIVSTDWLQWKAAMTTKLKSKLILIRHAINENSITLKINIDK